MRELRNCGKRKALGEGRREELSASEGKAVAGFRLRPYQEEAFQNQENGVECWLWGRQTGKSFTLAAWAVDRLMTRPGRLVTILSNSRANGMELNRKCGEICEAYHQTFEQMDLSNDARFETMNYETRVTVGGVTGRIKVLPANPRTARGFSGDLILDEFAFHEDSYAIWEAAEPILSANQDYLCRVASTPNGRHNMFYRIATNERVPLRKVPRSLAWEQGLKIYHPVTRKEISPAEARKLAPDKRAYDQNYECEFGDESMALLTHELISSAERPGVGIIAEGSWPAGYWEGLGCDGELHAGVDVGRVHDLTVITVIEKKGRSLVVRGMLRLWNVRLPEQQLQLEEICRLRRFRCAHIDMTGLGLGLVEYTQQRFGNRIRGINFACSVPITSTNIYESRRGENVRVPEALAMQLLQAYEDGQIEHPIDELLREDLRKPARVTGPTGGVSVAGGRSGGTHADHFWSLALAVNAAKERPAVEIKVVAPSERMRIWRDRFI